MKDRIGMRNRTDGTGRQSETWEPHGHTRANPPLLKQEK